MNNSPTTHHLPHTLLVTGGAGFIGSNFIRYILNEHSDWQIINLDKLTYAGNLENLEDVKDNPRYHFVKGDIADRKLVDALFSGEYFAANSLTPNTQDLIPNTQDLTPNTQDLTPNTQDLTPNTFLQVSTDEVYGSTEKGKFIEQSPLSPNSPYAASKAAADLLCHAYWKTYQLPVIITRCSNNLGPFQFPEKFIPLAVTNALENKSIPIYGDGSNVRDWIYVADHCRALDFALQKGEPGEIYNIAANQEKTNLELVYKLLNIMHEPQSLVTFVTDRPGHDRRYALDASKITTQLGWKPTYSFEEALTTTINWYVDHEHWWRKIKSGEYAEYYQRMYPQR